MGRRARERVLDEHTYRHRARQLLDLIDIGVTA
jgi:spore maturation protein CgeB